MKLKFSLVIGILGIASAGSGRAEWTVGSGAIALETSLSGIYDSNLNASAVSLSDYALGFEPMLRYRREDALFKIEGRAGVRVRRYDEHPEYDSEDADVRFDWRMPREQGRTKGANLSLGYLETSDAVLEVNERVRTKSFTADGGGDLLVAQRHVLGVGFGYRDNRRDFGSDQNSRHGRFSYSYVGIPDGSVIRANWQYQRSESQDSDTGIDLISQTARTASLDYSRPLYQGATGTLTWGYRWLERGEMEALLGLPDRNGSFVGVTLDGPFLPESVFPKTTGTIRLGYEQAEVPGLNDTSNERFVGEVNVSWQARPTTRFSVRAERSQELTINDQTVVSEGGGVAWNQQIGRFVEADLKLSYENANFVGQARSDDRYEAIFSCQYARNQAWPLRLLYSYLDSESSLPLANYQRHVVNLTLSHLF